MIQNGLYPSVFDYDKDVWVVENNKYVRVLKNNKCLRTEKITTENRLWISTVKPLYNKQKQQQTHVVQTKIWNFSPFSYQIVRKKNFVNNNIFRNFL